MSHVKRILVLLLVGALLGVGFACWVGPQVIAWWFAPPVQNSFLTCNNEISWAMQSLVKTQLAIAGGCAVLVAIVGSLVARSLRLRAERKANTPALPQI